MPEDRTPAQIEADIARRQQDLAATLDEIAVRLHPQTLLGDAKARLASTVDRSAGRAYVSANRALSRVRGQVVTEEGAPRLARVVPVAAAAVAVAALVVVAARRRRR